MNGLDKIIKEIAAEAESGAGRIVREAELEAERIKDRARTKAAEIEKSAASDAELEYKKIISRAASSGEVLIKRAVLKEKQDIVSDILRAAKEKILSLEDSEYFALLLALLEKYASGEKGIIIMNDRDSKRITSGFKKAAKEKGLASSSDTRAIDGGFVLVYGNIEENCSFTALMENERDMLFDTVNGFLF